MSGGTTSFVVGHVLGCVDRPGVDAKAQAHLERLEAETDARVARIIEHNKAAAARPAEGDLWADRIFKYLDQNPRFVKLDKEAREYEQTRARLGAETQTRVAQAFIAFGCGLDGAHITSEGTEEFRRLVESRIAGALASLTVEEFRPKWAHVLRCYRAVGQLAAWGKATVGAAEVVFAWNAAVDKEHATGGTTDFCSENPPGY